MDDDNVTVPVVREGVPQFFVVFGGDELPERIEGVETTTRFPVTLEDERGDRDVDAASDTTGLIYSIGSRIDEDGPLR